MNTPIPSLKKRLTSMVYEGLLLVGPILVGAFIFAVAFQQRHALYLRHQLLSLIIFIVAFYFILSWTRGGQTLPMKTWGIRLVTSDGHPVKLGRAIFRYVLTWLWILPGLLLAWLFNAKTYMAIVMPMANLIIWALAVYLDPARQFLHDRLAGTQLISVPTPWAKHIAPTNVK